MNLLQGSRAASSARARCVLDQSESEYLMTQANVSLAESWQVSEGNLTISCDFSGFDWFMLPEIFMIFSEKAGPADASPSSNELFAKTTTLQFLSYRLDQEMLINEIDLIFWLVLSRHVMTLLVGLVESGVTWVSSVTLSVQTHMEQRKIWKEYHINNNWWRADVCLYLSLRPTLVW